MLGRSLSGGGPHADPDRMRRAVPSRPPLGRYVPALLATFAVVVCSFLASTYYTETRLADVDRQSAAVTRDATNDLLATLRANTTRTDHALGRVIESDATRDRDTSARLEVAEHRVTAIAVGLDAASFVLSVVAALVALRVVRRSLALSERRAHELELFASRVAHDIRGPLTPALLALQLGLKGLDEGHRLRPAFERGVRTLLVVASIVDGLYAFAKSGARPQPGARASLRDAVEGVATEVGALAAERGVTIDIAPIPTATLCCAPGVLLSILSNLVRNAVKYGGAGTATSGLVSIRAFTSGHAAVRVEVSDAGPGLPAGSEESIFEPYVRGAVGSEMGLGGLGLGLATVRRLVESHGGSVGVVSRSRQGSTFWFELPVAAPESSPEAAMFAPGSALR